MKLLILGGTAFVGRHIVAAALVRGHAVTIFHRGRTNARLFADVETLLGDRDSDMAPLRGGKWDAVVDTSGYVPRIVAKSAALLAGAAAHYMIVSSISVYANFSRAGMAENTPRAVLKDASNETVDAETYGPLKARCERAAAEHFPGRTLAVRPGIIVGPYYYTGRFAYWPRRMAGGGEVLAPGAPDRPLQVIDASDLATWMVARIEAGDASVYNATGPAAPLTWGAFLAAAGRASGDAARITWVADETLTAAGVSRADLPLWIAARPETAAFYAVSSAKAQAAGLTYRLLAASLADALASSQGKAGWLRHREAELLRRLTLV